MPLELIEIPAGKRDENADIKRVLQLEAKDPSCRSQFQPHCNARGTGKPMDTHQLAKSMEKWQLDGRDVSIDWWTEGPFSVLQRLSKSGHYPT